ncbi:MAG: polyprenyl synthetase family protein [Bacteroidales bacterium]|nr:polyprenyl synthetase family protein [Bacteroidales bacterium]
MHPFVPPFIKDEFLAFEKNLQHALSNDNTFIYNILSHINKEQGKQLRPILVLLSAAINGEINKKTHSIASLVELLHISSLIHDDVIDNSSMRRNHQTVNSLWNNKIAVLLGDYLLAKCMQLLQWSEDSELSGYVSQLVQKMTEGEIIQLSYINNYSISEEEYYNIIEAKTAALFKASLYLGAYSVDAQPETCATFEQIGKHMGLAFQMKDDLMDYNKSLKDKDFAKDIKEHIITLPLIYTLQNMSDTEKNSLITLYKNHQHKKENLIRIIDIVGKHGGIDYTNTKIQSEVNKSISLIHELKQSEHTEILIQLLQQIFYK